MDQGGAAVSEGQTDRQSGQKSSPDDAWQEVGRQFQILGETIAQAFRASVNDEETRRRMQTMQSSLHSMVNEVDRAIEDTMKSPSAQEARAEAQKAAEVLRDAAEQTVQEIRPHLLAALKQVNEELRKFVGGVERGGQKPPTSGPSEKEQP